MESFGIWIAEEKGERKRGKKGGEHAKRIAHLNSARWGTAQQLHKLGLFPAVLKSWQLFYYTA